MPVIKHQEIEFGKISMEGVVGASKANVIAQREGWESHTLRVFRLEPGGHTPYHQHPWEHVNYFVGGKGELKIGNEVHEINVGDFAFVPPNAEHQFKNPFDKPLEFICIVPVSGA